MNGVAERALRRAKEGTAVALTQSGLPEEWRDCVMECYCYLRNVHDKMAYGETAFEKRFLEKFDVPSLTFGTLVEHVPITVKDNARIHQFGEKTLGGIFLGYASRAGKRMVRRHAGCRL